MRKSSGITHKVYIICIFALVTLYTNVYKFRRLNIFIRTYIPDMFNVLERFSGKRRRVNSEPKVEINA